VSDGLILSMRAETLLARMAGKADQLQAANVSSVTRLSIVVQTGVKEGRLTGQVLHVRSGTLRRSINRRVETTESGVTAVVGTNVRYAAVHEYGFEGDVTVKAHTRRTALQLSAKRSQRPKKSEGETQVRSFTRRMRMPERSYLRSEVRSRADEIRQTIREAALQAVRDR
jgi:phage gpG-like protein